MGVARDERESGGRPRPCQRPVVASSDPGGKGRERGVAALQRLSGVRLWPPVLDARRNDQHGGGRRAGAEVGGQPGAELTDEARAPDLHPPGPHLHVTDLEDCQAVPGCPGLRLGFQQLELDGPGARGREERVDTGRVGIEHRRASPGPPPRSPRGRCAPGRAGGPGCPAEPPGRPPARPIARERAGGRTPCATADPERGRIPGRRRRRRWPGPAREGHRPGPARYPPGRSGPEGVGRT